MSQPLGNPLVIFNPETKTFEPYVSIGFNNLLLNTELTCPGDNTKFFNVENGIMTVEENNEAISKRALKVSPKYQENPPTSVWSKVFNSATVNKIVTDYEGNIYVVSSDRTVKKINASGTEVWSYTENTDSVNLICIDTKTLEVFIYLSDKKLKKLSSSGALVWEYSNFSNVATAMCFDSESKQIYVVDGKRVKVINTDDTSAGLNHMVDIECTTISDMTLDSSGNKYLLIDGFIRKYNDEFKSLWEFRCLESGISVRSFCVDIIDNNVFICGTDKKVRKLSSSGNSLWEFSSNGYIPTECVSDRRGYVYVTFSNNLICKFDPLGNMVWSYTTTNIPNKIVLDDFNNFYFIDTATRSINKIAYNPTFTKSRVYQEVSLLPNRIYSLSFLCKTSEDGVLSTTIGTSISFNNIVNEKSKNTYIKHVHCFETPSTIDPNKSYKVAFEMSVASDIYLSDLKLEEGNVNTTWSASTKDERIRYETHGAQTVFDPNGVHGIRYNAEEETLELGNGQDWMEIKTGGGSGGIIVGGPDYFTNATVTDSTAEFPVVKVASSTTRDVVFFEGVMEDMILGRYSTMLRLKSDNISITTPLIKVEMFHRLNGVDTKLVEANIRGTDFDAANTWKSMGFVFDFKGNSNSDKLLVIKGTILKQTQICNISLDYTVTNFVYTNVGAIQTTRY